MLLSAMALSGPVFAQSAAEKYDQMDEARKLRFIEDRSNEFLGLFPGSENGKIDSDGVRAVKESVETYLGRNSIESGAIAACGFRESLTDVLFRGQRVATDIGSAFVGQGLPAGLGIYVAMIESEFCACLQSPTGALGMFQFTAVTGADLGLQTRRDASPNDPDDRCDPKLAAAAAATWFNQVLERDFSRNATGVPFAVSAFNAGQGNTKKLIRLTNVSKSVDFTYWAMRRSVLRMLKPDPAGKVAVEQFVKENSKYFPKLLAALIIGENPGIFGIEMDPLSRAVEKRVEFRLPKAADGADRNAELEFFQKQRRKALEPRDKPIGSNPPGLNVPAELRLQGVVKQRAKMKEMIDEGFVQPLDFADLAKMRSNGELVELPIATETYVVEVGGSAEDSEFKSFDFNDGAKPLTPGSPKYAILKKLADDFDGAKYDLNNPRDRKQMRIRLLRMVNPETKKTIEELAAAYHARFKRPLRITSLIRSIDYQISLNAIDPNTFVVRTEDSLPPHSSGCAFDIARKPMTADEQNFLMQKLKEMEAGGKVDAMVEYGTNAVLHVFVYQDGKPPDMSEN
jgi:hypothetical protein